MTDSHKLSRHKTMDDCPKFHTCSANICPLDKDWRLRTHIKGERVCHLMCEAAKPDAEATFRGVGRGDLLPLILEVMPEIASRWGSIRRTLVRAKKTGSRMKQPGTRYGQKTAMLNVSAKAVKHG